MRHKKAAGKMMGVLVGLLIVLLLGAILAGIVPSIFRIKSALCLRIGGCNLGSSDESEIGGKTLTFKDCISKNQYPDYSRETFSNCKECDADIECFKIKRRSTYRPPADELKQICEADICGLTCKYLNSECYELISYSANCDDKNGRIISKDDCKIRLKSLPLRFNWKSKTIVDISITINGIKWQYLGKDAVDGQDIWISDEEGDSNEPCLGDLIFDSSVSDHYFTCSTNSNYYNEVFLDFLITEMVISKTLGSS